MLIREIFIQWSSGLAAKKSQTKKRNNRVFSTGEEETESRRRSATAGSEITNSIVLRRVTRLLRNFLPATSRRRGVRSKRGGCGEGKKALLPAPLIFLCVCVFHKRMLLFSSDFYYVSLWVVQSGSDVSVLITFMPFQFIPFFFHT